MLDSKLFIDVSYPIQINLPPTIPSMLYRDFEQESHRDNFMQGNIWFAGPNQLRFFLGDPERRDPHEYRNPNGTIIHSYSLSLTTRKPIHGPIVQIRDICGFVYALAEDMKRALNHCVSWLSVEELKAYQTVISAISQIKNTPTNQDEVGIYASSITLDQIEYFDKENRFSAPYDSKDVGRFSLGKDRRSASEEEWRVSLGMGSFMPPFAQNSLHNLVQYLKLNSPNSSQYCEKI